MSCPRSYVSSLESKCVFNSSVFSLSLDKGIPAAGVREERRQAARRGLLPEDHGRHLKEERPGQRRTDQRQGVQHLRTRRAVAPAAAQRFLSLVVDVFCLFFLTGFTLRGRNWKIQPIEIGRHPFFRYELKCVRIPLSLSLF